MQLPEPHLFDQTLAQVCHQALDQNPDRILLSWKQSTFTVKDIIGRANVVAVNLQTTGVTAGKPVGVMLDNHPDHVAVLLALGLLGAVWVPIDRRFKSANVKNILTTAKVDLVIAEPGYCDLIEWAMPECTVTGVEELVTRNDMATNVIAHWSMHPDDTRALMFTSGTTGVAKAVIVTERMFTGSALFCACASQADRRANFYLWEPLNHIGGAQIIPMALLFGSKISMTERFSASRFWTEVINCGANRIHYLGGILELLLANAPADNEQQHQVELAFGAGASTSVAAAFTQRFAIPLREVYGMTEAASFTTINIDGPTGSIGRPLPYFQLSLRDQENNEVRRGETGEIALSCPTVPLLTPGYYHNSIATEAAFRDQHFYTGDLAREDDDGYLYFCGRLKDRVRCKGENVTASDIESVFNAHPMVAESAVIGIGAQNVDQEIAVFLQLSTSHCVETSQDDLLEIIRSTDAQLASFEQPRYVMIVEDFPKTPTERIQKHKLPIDKVSGSAWDRRADFPTPRAGERISAERYPR